MGSPTERMHMIEVTHQLVDKHAGKKGEVSKEKIVALLSVQYGIARRTALEYIRNLVAIEKIIEEDGDVWVK